MRIHTIGRASLAVAGVLALGACDILDVENPNNLVEESIENPAAAAAVVNGSLSLVSQAISSMWEPYLVASDEMYWIGSRDAWFELDQGFISNEFNEFTDAAFPNLGEARWMSDRAVAILEGHVANDPSADMRKDLARANLYAGVAYMLIGEVQEDFAFSDKTQDAPPVGPSNMSMVFDGAISRLDDAVSLAGAVGDDALRTRALAARARAKFSRALWNKVKPTPNTSSPLVADAGAAADAQAVIDAVGATVDWSWDLQYSAATVSNGFAGNVNSRQENAFDPSVAVAESDDRPFDIVGVALMDPIDNVPDPVITTKLNEFKGGEFTNTGNSYAPLSLVDARMMHLILAENALAGGDTGGFATHINHIRAMDGLTDFSGQISNMDMLKHSRRVNTFLMGLRLFDMYRFGISDGLWQGGSDIVTSPGTLLPITIIEIRANCYLNGSCSG